MKTTSFIAAATLTLLGAVGALAETSQVPVSGAAYGQQR